MALLEDGILASENLMTGLVVSIGAVILAPVLFPAVATAAKPLVKRTIKLGVNLYEKGNEAVAEMGEVLEDLLAEAKSEMAATEKVYSGGFRDLGGARPPSSGSVDVQEADRRRSRPVGKGSRKPRTK